MSKNCDEKCDHCGITLNHYCMACDTGGHPAGRLYKLYRSLLARVRDLLEPEDYAEDYRYDERA